VAEQKEVGAKYENDQLGVTLSLFDINKQRGILKMEYLVILVNTFIGVELSSYGKLTDSLTVLGGLTWMHATQEETGSTAYDGNYEVGVPKFQANLGTNWKLPLRKIFL
jgi:iron complex outermembrane receptor protein